MTLGLTALVLTQCSPTAFFSSGVASLDTTSQERGLGGYISDTEIQARINVVLFEHDINMHHAINVSVYEGRVLLTGCLQTPEMKEDAVRLTWQVPGVKTVSDETTVASQRTLANYAHDKWISTKINSLLFITSGISSRNYEVIVSGGVVYLVGIATTQEELDHVIDICRHIKNVQKVVSYVRLMDIHEIRRRKLFNDRKTPSPLDRSRTEKRQKMLDRRGTIRPDPSAKLPESHLWKVKK